MTKRPTDRKPWWRRFRARLSVRAMIGLVLVIGGGMGWLTRTARIQRESVAIIRAAEGSVVYGWPLRSYDDDPTIRPTTLEWLAGAIGVDYLASVDEVHGGIPHTSRAMSAVARLPHLESLSLSGSGASPTRVELAPLRDHPRLKRLNYDHRFGDGAVELDFLGSLPHLEELNISGVYLKSRGLAPVAGLPRLRSLDVDADNLSETKLIDLGSLHDLRNLRLKSGRRINNAGLAHLRGLSRLESLDFKETWITDLGPIRNLTGLKNLDLADSSLTDEGLAPVAGLAALETLVLSSSYVGDDGMAHLVGLTRLTRLDIRYTSVGDAGLMRVADVKSLRELWISGNVFTEAGKAALEAARPDLLIHRKAVLHPD